MSLGVWKYSNRLFKVKIGCSGTYHHVYTSLVHCYYYCVVKSLSSLCNVCGVFIIILLLLCVHNITLCSYYYYLEFSVHIKHCVSGY